MSGASAQSGAKARKSSVGLNVHQARFTVPDVRRIIKASAEDMHRLVAAVAVHLIVRIVAGAANDTWLPSVDSEQFVLKDHRRVDLSLLHLVLYCIAVDHRRPYRLPKLYRVEFGSTDRAAVGTLNPRLEAGIVQVVSAGE